MKKLLTLACIGALSCLPVFAQAKKAKTTAPVVVPASNGNVADITAAQMKDYLYFIASDEMEGRDTPSRGLDTTAKFLAMMMSRWGLQPAGDNGTYFQKMKLRRDKLEPDATVASINGQTFKFGDDFLARPIPGSVSGNCVYVANGYVIKDKNINAYETPNGKIDVKDKIVIVLAGLPKGVTFQTLRSGKQGEDWIDPLTYAAKNGAKAVITVPSYGALSNWNRTRQTAIEKGALTPDKISGDGDEPKIPNITISIPMLNALFQGEKEPGLAIFSRATSDPVAPFDLNPNKKVSITVGGKFEALTTQNVVAVLPGSDPVLKNEYVAVGAHYDHVGIGAPDAKGDTLYNGADDDGSGTTAVLAMAEAFAKGSRPKRSILFVWHCGEEKGLWGSEYFTKFPTVDIKQIITQLNIDMIGRSKKDGDTDPRNNDLSGSNEVYVIGSKMMSSELGALSERVNNGFLNVKFNYKYDDPKDTNRFFFRSDHFNYAQKGIPIIFYFDGVHEDYHRPGDQPEKIDYQKMEKITRTVFATAWELSNNTPTRPKIDKQLPPELVQH